MERALFYLRLFPGTEAEYDRRHAAIWPELAAEIRESGLRKMSGFRRGTDVWYYLEAEPDKKTAFEVHGPKPKNQEWGTYFRNVIAEITGPDGGLIWYDEIFHAGGEALPGPMTRGFLSLVIDPDRAADYDHFHAHPWPDMMAAIEQTGFRNYTGFRRGANVVYYGEFYPDMATAYDRIAQLEVNDRWGKAFEGIITTIVDGDGNLITADEVFHQD
ncbi:MAG: L-rhamnose mutarotase [Chloroflexota bacterium]